MYPFARLFWQLFVGRNDQPLGLTDTHVSSHICWPWDLDIWSELNNGRTLSIYDLGRIPLANRVGLTRILRENRWGLTMAGASVRYRRRVRMFDKIEMHSRAVSWDDRFIYLEQSMWVRGEATSHILYRTAVTSRDGIVPTERVIAAFGLTVSRPEMPDWVEAWIAAEAQRPWPPMGKTR